jgi:RNA polymerase sigma-70 factor (ECF subfamily)
MENESLAATRWTLVVAAARLDESAPAIRALAELCQTYWPPLYAYLRRQGYDTHDAEDLTQEFFSRLLAKNYLADADPAKGRFRSFLLASLKHFLSNQRDRSRAQKRGGGQPMIALDALTAEARARIEPADNSTPDKAYDRQWALTLLDQALRRLRREYATAGREELFDNLKIFLTADAASALSHAEIGVKCGMSEGAVKVAAHRLRRRYRDLLREEVAQTVSSPEEVEGEIRELFAAFQPG